MVMSPNKKQLKKVKLFPKKERGGIKLSCPKGKREEIKKVKVDIKKVSEFSKIKVPKGKVEKSIKFR